MLEHLKHFYWALIATWKPISIGIAGAFGMLGLLTEFRDKKKPHKPITPWGWTALAGIIISSVFGIAAQQKGFHDDSEKALALATNSDTELRDIQRLLTSISDPRVEILYEFDCNNRGRFRDYDNFCQDIRNAQEEMQHLHIPDPEFLQGYYKKEHDVANWKRYPELLDSHLFLDISLNIFTDLEAAKQFVNYPRSTKPDLQMHVRSYRKDLGTDALEVAVDEDKVGWITRNDLVHELRSSENMVSIHDLPGTTLVVTANDFGQGFGPVRPVSITITTRQGLSVIIPRLEKFGRAFRYTFPKPVAKPQPGESSTVPSPATK